MKFIYDCCDRDVKEDDDHQIVPCDNKKCVDTRPVSRTCARDETGYSQEIFIINTLTDAYGPEYHEKTKGIH